MKPCYIIYRSECMSFAVEITNASLIRRIISFIIDYVILLPFILILYPLWKDILWNGQSFGNKIVGLRLIDFKTGKRPSFLRILVKNMIFILTLSLGSVFLFMNDGRRGLGDLLTSTILVTNFKLK